jgi:RNA recognition motif-containing protein
MFESHQSYLSFIDLTNSLLECETKPSDSNQQSNESLQQTISFSLSSLEDELLNFDSAPSEDLKNEFSPLLILKKVSSAATELDIIHLCSHFGIIQDLSFNKEKEESFVLFKDSKSSRDCYESMKKVLPVINGQPIFVSTTEKKSIPKAHRFHNQPSRFLALYLSSETEVITTLLVNRIVSMYGNILKLEIIQGRPVQAFIEMEDLGSSIVAKENLDGSSYYDVIHLRASYVDELSFRRAMESKTKYHSLYSQEDFLQGLSQSGIDSKSEESMTEYDSNNKVSSSTDTDSSSTVIVKGIPKQTTLKQLFRLFSCFGNVTKIKIFYTNPENALIEFQDSDQSNLAKNLLNGCPFRGNYLSVGISKNPIIINIPYIPEGHKYLADYSHSKEHRYRIAGSKNIKNIARPSPVLHLSNLCEDKDETFYRKLFEGYGHIVKMFTLRGKPTSILVEMANINDAVEVLVHFHNFSIEGKFLKVSFSKYHTIKY